MRNVKIISIIFICVSLLCSFATGCTSISEDDSAIPIFDFHGSYSFYYSIDELLDQADVVAEVRVNEHQKTEMIASLPFTTSAVEIQEVYKGDLSKNEVILVNELGGLYRPHLFGDPSQPQQEEFVEMRVEGVSVMQPGDIQIIFAKLDDELDDGSYTIFALWQGKFKIQGDQADRGVAKHEEVNENFVFESAIQLKDKIKMAKVTKEREND
ncbi:hypothetical protein DUZ99_10500 [Xylanibacillus composti]|uniref:Lipoprotein n=1 Tax=Xylanibacillus composti TaxID=1572762 RepID=A0A8J4M421_9BACL|nr:hypothetical protein [Xylanibacillus composti]MDT9725400.1 hypothetical protein [Xylanibacillus composti]GIQ71449.1 hypothetical protein XYCOK13_42730 [Xylanibacillus composti]